MAIENDWDPWVMVDTHAMLLRLDVDGLEVRMRDARCDVDGQYLTGARTIDDQTWRKVIDHTGEARIVRWVEGF